VAAVREDAKGTEATASDLLESAGDLSERAKALNAEVQQFIAVLCGGQSTQGAAGDSGIADSSFELW
jgi:hypothetical protein